MIAALFVVGLVVVVIATCVLVGLFRAEDDGERVRMRSLIARLAKAESHEVRIAGELLLGHTKKDETVRAEIKAEGKKAIPCLIEGLHHVNEDVRIECAYMLADMPCREGVQALVGCLERDADLVPPPWALNMALHRMTAYGQYLPPSDRQGARDLWIPWWKEHETQLVNTQSGIGLRQDDGTVVPLPLESAKGPYDNLPARVNWDVRELKNPHPAMRAAAALGLGEIGDRAAVPFLVDALKDEQWLVRRDVATALGRIGDPRAVPALENALQDEETLVRSAAAEALQKIRQGGVRE